MASGSCALHLCVVGLIGFCSSSGVSYVYRLPENACRSNAVSRKRWSSSRCVCLFPVAGAAVASRPAYLKHTHMGLSLQFAHTHTLAAQRCFPASSPDRAGVASAGGEAGLDVVVVTLVLVLLLAPNQVCVDELVDFSLHQIEGEWRELQGTHKRRQTQA